MRMRLLSIELQAFFYKTQPNPNYESNFYALEVILNQLLDTTSTTDILDSLSLVKTFFKDHGLVGNPFVGFRPGYRNPP
jgi:hypothetical protein